MSASKVKAARRTARAAQSAQTRRSAQLFSRYWKGLLVAVAVLAILGGSVLLPDALDNKSNAHSHATMGEGDGTGLPAGAQVPDFNERDVETGNAISSTTIYGSKTLLFFSEGVMCQACFEQIKGLEQFGAELDRRGIRLVAITPDSPSDLRSAVSDYGIASPMIADENRDMSEAFNTLGQGMHGDTPGHAFVLVDRGKVLWYRDYWLAPTRSMYVEPKKLLADIPT